MAKRWRHGLHVTMVSLLIGALMVDTAAACKLFGRRSCRCYVPAVVGQCQSEKALPAEQFDPPASEASPSDSLLTPKPEVDPPAFDSPAEDAPAVEPPAVPPVPPAPVEAAPPAAAPAVDVEPIPATPAPAAAPPTPRVAPTPVPPVPTRPAPAATPPAPTPPAAESFDDLFPPATPVAPASPEAPAPVPAPSPNEDDPFAPAAPTPALPAAPAVDDDDPFAPAPAGNRTSRPAAPASPPPATDPFANPFRTSAASAFPVREWNDDSGLFQIRGQLLAIVGGKVRILKTTGRTTTVPLSRLSVADRQYVAEAARSNGPAAPKVAAR